ncbi:DUF1775 domain-containing protein [Streptomyces sp. NPDC051104]|uniref:DUF1775 domain-containing protein n=1 Tax=Streptomyces sp. NPDC051104 TaxID=3155044 RepID=UPI0034212632
MFHASNKHATNRRLTLVTAVTVTAVLLTAGPASAHVEVESEQAQALAENVTIHFEAESESDSAGITKLRVVLPEGIAPSDVQYSEGPRGWKFTAADDGYTVEGPALKAGVNAEYSIVVKQLPDAKELPFKTLQTYSDGHTDRWIELDENGENPAPTLKLKAAAPDAKPANPSPSATASTSPSAAPEETQPSASPTPQAREKDDDGGLPTGAWVGIGAAIVIAVAAGGYAVRRRSSAQQ